MPAVFIVAVIVHVISAQLASNATRITKTEKMIYPDIVPYLKYRRNWLKIAVYLQALDIACIILAFTATAMTIFVVVGAKNGDAELSRIVLYSTLSFLFSLVSIVLRPMKTAKAFKKAYYRLNAVLQVFMNQSGCSDDVNNDKTDSCNNRNPSGDYSKLVEAVKKGEKLIAKAQF
jgi:hypothetical protein